MFRRKERLTSCSRREQIAQTLAGKNMKKLITLLLMIALNAGATDTYLRYSLGKLVVVNGVIQIGAGTVDPLPQFNKTIAYYTFTTNNTLTDSSYIGTNVLTDPGGANAPAFSSNSVTFGGNDFLDATNAVANSFPNPASVTNLTVGFWAKTSSTANNGFFAFSPFGGAHGRMDGSVLSKWRADMRTPTRGTFSANFSDNTWHHFLVTVIPGTYTNSSEYVTNKIAIYIDKVIKNADVLNSTNTWDFTTPAGSRLILGAYYSSTYGFAGSMDDFTVWTVPLSNGGSITNGGDIATGEIAEVYDKGRSSP